MSREAEAMAAEAVQKRFRDFMAGQRPRLEARDVLRGGKTRVQLS